MAQPIGFIYPQFPTHVRNLHKSYYDLKMPRKHGIRYFTNFSLQFASPSLLLIFLYVVTHTLMSLPMSWYI